MTTMVKPEFQERGESKTEAGAGGGEERKEREGIVGEGGGKRKWGKKKRLKDVQDK